MTGAWRRALSQEPCMFMPTSTGTSKLNMPARPMSSTTGVVARPTMGSESETTVPATSMTRRVPKRAMAGPTVALAIKPLTPAIDISRPMPATLIPTRSRISGNRGMNEATSAPLTKNCTAMARRACPSSAVNARSFDAGFCTALSVTDDFDTDIGSNHPQRVHGSHVDGRSDLGDNDTAEHHHADAVRRCRSADCWAARHDRNVGRRESFCDTDVCGPAVEDNDAPNRTDPSAHRGSNRSNSLRRSTTIIESADRCTKIHVTTRGCTSAFRQGRVVVARAEYYPRTPAPVTNESTCAPTVRSAIRSRT